MVIGRKVVTKKKKAIESRWFRVGLFLVINLNKKLQHKLVLSLLSYYNIQKTLANTWKNFILIELVRCSHLSSK